MRFYAGDMMDMWGVAPHLTGNFLERTFPDFKEL